MKSNATLAPLYKPLVKKQYFQYFLPIAMLTILIHIGNIQMPESVNSWTSWHVSVSFTNRWTCRSIIAA